MGCVIPVLVVMYVKLLIWKSLVSSKIANSEWNLKKSLAKLLKNTKLITKYSILNIEKCYFNIHEYLIASCEWLFRN